MNIIPTSWRCSAVAGGLMMLSSLLIDGCASSRLIKNPAQPKEVDTRLTASKAEGLTVVVQQLIVRNSGGSWVRDANWDEYVLTIKNESPETIEVLDINLYSEKLAAPVESSTSLEQLDARSNRTLQAMKDVGIVGGVGIVAPSAMILGAVGTSGGLLSASTAGAAAAAVGIVAIPVGLIGGTSYVISRHRRAKEDKVLIERRLDEHGLVIPLEIPPGAEIQKSAFFPVTPAPTRLVISEVGAGNAVQISVDLPGLARLHLKPLRVAGTSAGSLSAAR